MDVYSCASVTLSNCWKVLISFHYQVILREKYMAMSNVHGYGDNVRGSYKDDPQPSVPCNKYYMECSSEAKC